MNVIQIQWQRVRDSVNVELIIKFLTVTLRLDTVTGFRKLVQVFLFQLG